MVSVTQRIREVRQPRGGYLPAKDFSKIELDDGVNLYSQENVHPSLIGLSVDYLSRFMNGSPKERAFAISLRGAEIIGEGNVARELLASIAALDDRSIVSTIKLVGYDVVFRAGPQGYKPIEEIEPDEWTIFNVRKMVIRSLKFFEQFGPVTKDGFTFEGAYTELINSGDGDFLTKDTLWDFKVSRSAINKNQTLQLLIYYLLGRYSIYDDFSSITKLGIFNPRLNTVYLLEVSSISPEVISEVEREVIGYGLDNNLSNSLGASEPKSISPSAFAVSNHQRKMSRDKFWKSFMVILLSLLLLLIFWLVYLNHTVRPSTDNFSDQSTSSEIISSESSKSKISKPKSKVKKKRSAPKTKEYRTQPSSSSSSSSSSSRNESSDPSSYPDSNEDDYGYSDYNDGNQDSDLDQSTQDEGQQAQGDQSQGQGDQGGDQSQVGGDAGQMPQQ